MPDAAQVHAKLLEGVALQQAGQLEEAREVYRQVLKHDPRNFDALHLLGVIAAQEKDFAESVKLIGRAITINPSNATAHYNRGIAFDELRQYDAAIAAYDKAIKLKPDHAVAYNNRGIALSLLRRLEEAVASFTHALAPQANYADAYYNRAHALADLGRLDDALADFDHALRLNPGHSFLPGVRLHTKMRLCDWRGADHEIADLEARIARGEHASTPWPALTLTDDPALQHKNTQTWANITHPQNPLLGDIPPRGRSGKIRIGYFSMDFRDHPVAQLTARMFELHDRKRFDIVAFSYGPDTKDAMRQRLRGTFDRFLDVREKSDAEIAKLAREMRVDIAVDLAGYTTGARPGVMALRAAPIQVSYLGYAGTMAAPYIDYAIGDRIVIPESRRKHFSEKIAELPCFLASDDTRAIADRVFARKEAGLPERGFVFCCFNTAHKILPATFNTWSRILKHVDGSVLWLAGTNPTAVKNLRREAEQRGLDPARLIFAERLPSTAEHLARHRLADLSLDTLPFNAHTTASDALWCGVPHLTCAGQSFAGRVGASLLHAAGLPELIASSPAEYEALAITLATQTERLRELRDRLGHGRTTALFNTAQFTRRMEDVYTRMVERYNTGLPPDHLTTEY